MTARPDRIRGRNFGRVPDELLNDPGIPGDACKLYATLTRYGQQRERIAPPRPELAGRLGWSLDKLDRMIRVLEVSGCLHVERHKGIKGERRTEESVYWLDGLRPGQGAANRTDAPDPSRKSAASPSRNGAADASRTVAATIRTRERASPNGEGGSRKRDRRADTLVGKCIEAMGGTRPVEAKAFAGIVDNASKAGMPDDLIAKTCREWWQAREPVAFLTGRLGQAQRKAAAEPAAPSYVHDPSARPGHDPDACGLCAANRKDAEQAGQVA